MLESIYLICSNLYSFFLSLFLIVSSTFLPFASCSLLSSLICFFLRFSSFCPFSSLLLLLCFHLFHNFFSSFNHLVPPFPSPGSIYRLTNRNKSISELSNRLHLPPTYFRHNSVELRGKCMPYL